VIADERRPERPAWKAPVDLDSLSLHWRVAFNAAQDALRSGELYIAREDEAALQRALVLERKETASLIEAVAHEEHLALVHHVASPRATNGVLGLPRDVAGCVFELEGVLTAAAPVHAAAWAQTFEPFLLERAERNRHRYVAYTPFNPESDYDAYIRGRPRLDGVQTFLASRGIRLPLGTPADPPGTATVHGLANAKNAALQRVLARDGVHAYDGSRLYLEELRDAGLRCAVVSASANTAAILARSGLAGAVDVRVDGVDIAREHLHAWPAPDVLLAACRKLGLAPARVAAFETGRAGVTAARRAELPFVVAVERHGAGAELREAGADTVVADLAELLDPSLR